MTAADVLHDALIGDHFCEVEPGSGVGSHLTIEPHEAAYIARVVRSACLSTAS